MRVFLSVLLAWVLSTPSFAENEVFGDSLEEFEVVAFRFKSEASVFQYLEAGTYTGNGLVVNIKQSGVYANGRQITGEVSVERFNDDVALISMCPPGYKRVYFRVDASNNTLIDNQGYLYKRS